MKYLLPLFAIGLLSLACNGTASQGRPSAKAKRLVFGEEKGPMSKWQLLQIYDPYDGGVIIHPEADNPHYLIFFSRGRFLEYDSLNYNDGRWLIDPKANKLALIHEIENGHRIPPARQDTIFRYHLLQQGDTLRLGIQGRHGIVEETYLPVSDE